MMVPEGLLTPGAAALASSIPLLWLMAGMGVLRMAAHKVCFAGLMLSLILAVVLCGMDPTRAADQIKALLSGLSEDRRIQALIIAWGFGSFMEGVAGFGTAVAVPAALLISLGFQPFTAAVLCLLANTIAVPFGVIGLPVSTLVQVTGLPIADVSWTIALQLSPFVLLAPVLIVLYLTRSLNALREVWLPTLAGGAGFVATQMLVLRFVGPELPAVLGAMASTLCIVLCARVVPPKTVWRFKHEQAPAPESVPGPVNVKHQLSAWSPYILLLALALVTSPLFPYVRGALLQVSTSFAIYDGPGGNPHTVYWLLTPGTLVLASAVAGGLLQGASVGGLARLLWTTVVQLRFAGLTILCIVAIAKVMTYSGMVQMMAVAIAGAAGGLYPFFAPFLGALGTFLTGSDTSSALLFGPLQKSVALNAGLSPVWISASNSSGACIGKLISPQSITIAAMATGLEGREGKLLATALWFALPLLASVGVLVFALV